MRFRDRHDAGRRLAQALEPLRAANPIVLGLPRGGVPVAAEVARALGAPLDVVLVRKLGVPAQPELGFGAIGEDGVLVVRDEILRMARVSDEQMARVTEAERAELDRRALRFRGGRDPLPIAGRAVIVVDDGLATGSTARAALQVVRARGATPVILAVPVAPPETIERLGGEADQVVVLTAPASFSAVGQFYDDFTQTTDDEVIALLEAGSRPPEP